jgi:hypothetical protein
LATLVGLASGYALSGFVIGNDVNVGQEVLEENFKYLFVAQGISMIVFGIPGFWFQDHPPTPPSVSGGDHSHNGMSFWGEIKFCLDSPSFMGIFALFGVGYGLFVALWSTMQQLVLLTPLAAWIGISMVGGGIVGSAIVGVIIGKERSFLHYHLFANMGVFDR